MGKIIPQSRIKIVGHRHRRACGNEHVLIQRRGQPDHRQTGPERRTDAGPRILEGEALRRIAPKPAQARDVGQRIGLGPLKLQPVDRFAHAGRQAELLKLDRTAIARRIGDHAIGNARFVRPIEQLQCSGHHRQFIEMGAEPGFLLLDKFVVLALRHARKKVSENVGTAETHHLEIVFVAPDRAVEAPQHVDEGFVVQIVRLAQSSIEIEQEAGAGHGMRLPEMDRSTANHDARRRTDQGQELAHIAR